MAVVDKAAALNMQLGVALQCQSGPALTGLVTGIVLEGAVEDGKGGVFNKDQGSGIVVQLGIHQRDTGVAEDAQHLASAWKAQTLDEWICRTAQTCSTSQHSSVNGKGLSHHINLALGPNR